jgi:hypothetical protein
VSLGLVAAALVAWWVLRPRSKRRTRPVPWIVGGIGLVLIAAVLLGIAWPGGLLRQYETIPAVPDTVPADDTTTTIPGTTTSAPGATTPDATTGGTSPSATTTPPTTGP